MNETRRAPSRTNIHVRLGPAGADSATIGPAELPIQFVTEPRDPQAYRDRAASGELRPTTPPLPGEFLRCLKYPAGAHVINELVTVPGATMVVGGSVTVDVGCDAPCHLGRGDVLVVDEPLAAGSVRIDTGGCELVSMRLPEEAWRGHETSPWSGPHTDPAPTPLRYRMYEHAGASYLAPHRRFIDGNQHGRPIVGYRFIGLPAGFFLDWHPEVVNQLVVVLDGDFEVEVGGEPGRRQRFGPGDVCLAEDRTGQGHIDRTTEPSLLAVVVLDTEHLW